jgi:hypothetical protein
MRPLIALVGAITLSSCTVPGPPQYMTDAIRGEEDTRRALSRIQGELGPDFDTRVVEEVFFIAVNGGPRALETADAEVRRMVSELNGHYFSRRPTRPIRVYCFRDRSSYDAYVRSAYGRAPTTPYGFYMASERKMVLNLGTGRGTLSHEIVHPLLCEDFPEVPAWFNEGFASLFERTSTGRAGRLVGEVNWRVDDLKRAKREGREVPLRKLMETNTDEFYGDDRGVHYAMARFFCVYLQRQDLLDRFYREFRATAGDDPTGIGALERVTRKSLAEFEAEWRPWIDQLKAPGR